MEPGKVLLIIGLLYLLNVRCQQECGPGYLRKGRGRTFACIDDDECNGGISPCGEDQKCINTVGSYHCQCPKGFKDATPTICTDINECEEDPYICGNHSRCANTIGTYYCQCLEGFVHVRGQVNFTDCLDDDECVYMSCGDSQDCINTVGSYHCQCKKRYKATTPSTCSEVQCEQFKAHTAAQELFTEVDDLLVSHGDLDDLCSDSDKVTVLLEVVEDAIRLIGPQLNDSHTHIEENQTVSVEAELVVKKGNTPPSVPIHLNSDYASVSTDWNTATGNGTYSGFAFAALVTYKNLEKCVNHSFEHLSGHQKDGVDPEYQIYSKVVSVVVSNPSTEHLDTPVILIFRHLQIVYQEVQNGSEVNQSVICVYWKVGAQGQDVEGGAWDTHGCFQQSTNSTHTVCLCYHLSSFTVLRVHYPLENSFGVLKLLTTLGLVICLLCVAVCSVMTYRRWGGRGAAKQKTQRAGELEPAVLIPLGIEPQSPTRQTDAQPTVPIELSPMGRVDITVFTPSVHTEQAAEVTIIEYRFKLPGTGLFQCSVTRLVFGTTGEGEVLHRTVQWDERWLPSTGGPAGPLFDIQCPQESICQLHLPHCVVTPGDDLSVAHITKEGVNFLEPQEVTKTHVIVNVTHLSLFGLLWKIYNYIIPTYGQVLLFLRPPRCQIRKLSVLMLPSNMDIKEVMANHNKDEHIETTSECVLTPYQDYSLQCTSYEVQPEAGTYRLNYGPNFHPAFEVNMGLKEEVVSLKLLGPQNNQVWKGNIALEEYHPGPVPSQPNASTVTMTSHGAETLLSVRSDFVTRVSGAVLNGLLDKLLQEKVFIDEEMNLIKSKEYREEKARQFIDMVRNKGKEASSKMIAALHQLDPTLYHHLGLDKP